MVGKHSRGTASVLRNQIALTVRVRIGLGYSHAFMIHLDTQNKIQLFYLEPQYQPLCNLTPSNFSFTLLWLLLVLLWYPYLFLVLSPWNPLGLDVRKDLFLFIIHFSPQLSPLRVLPWLLYVKYYFPSSISLCSVFTLTHKMQIYKLSTVYT